MRQRLISSLFLVSFPETPAPRGTIATIGNRSIFNQKCYGCMTTAPRARARWGRHKALSVPQRGPLSPMLFTTRVTPARFPGDRFGQPLLEGCVDHAVQIHHAVEGLHVDQVRGSQGRISIEQRLHVGGDLRIARAAAQAAFPVGRASGQAADRENRRERHCKESSEASSILPHRSCRRYFGGSRSDI